LFNDTLETGDLEMLRVEGQVTSYDIFEQDEILKMSKLFLKSQALFYNKN
jgi:hypothetical protein